MTANHIEHRVSIPSSGFPLVKRRSPRLPAPPLRGFNPLIGISFGQACYQYLHLVRRRCFNPLIGISFGQAYEIVGSGDEFHRFNPLIGISFGQARSIILDRPSLPGRFNPLIGISFGQASSAVRSSSSHWLFQSPHRDFLWSSPRPAGGEAGPLIVSIPSSGFPLVKPFAVGWHPTPCGSFNPLIGISFGQAEQIARLGGQPGVSIPSSGFPLVKQILPLVIRLWLAVSIPSSGFPLVKPDSAVAGTARPGCFNPLIGISFGQAPLHRPYSPCRYTVSIPSSGFPLVKRTLRRRKLGQDPRFNPLIGISFGQAKGAIGAGREIRSFNPLIGISFGQAWRRRSACTPSTRFQSPHRDFLWSSPDGVAPLPFALSFQSPHRDFLWSSNDKFIEYLLVAGVSIPSSGFPLVKRRSARLPGAKLWVSIPSSGFPLVKRTRRKSLKAECSSFNPLIGISFGQASNSL